LPDRLGTPAPDEPGCVRARRHSSRPLVIPPSPGGAQLRLRTSEPSLTATLVDGQRTSKLVTLPAYPSWTYVGSTADATAHIELPHGRVLVCASEAASS
jgi:hypothetical protein